MAWTIVTPSKTYTLDKLFTTQASLSFRNGGNDSLTITTSEDWRQASPSLSYLQPITLKYSNAVIFSGIVTGIRKSASSSDYSVSYNVQGVPALWDRISHTVIRNLYDIYGSAQQRVVQNLWEINGATKLKAALSGVIPYGGYASVGTLDVLDISPPATKLTNATISDVVKYLLSSYPRAFSWFSYYSSSVPAYNLHDAYSSDNPSYCKTISDDSLVSIDFEAKDFNSASQVSVVYTAASTFYIGTAALSTEQQSTIDSDATITLGNESYGSSSSDLNHIRLEISAEQNALATFHMFSSAYNISDDLRNATRRKVFWERTGMAMPSGGWNAYSFDTPTIELESQVIGTTYNPASLAVLYNGGPSSQFLSLPSSGLPSVIAKVRVSQRMYTSTTSQMLQASVYATDTGNIDAVYRRVKNAQNATSGVAQNIYLSKIKTQNTGSITCKRTWTNQWNGFSSVRFVSLMGGNKLLGVQEVTYDLNTDLVTMTLGETPTLSPDDVIRTIRASTTT